MLTDEIIMISNKLRNVTIKLHTQIGRKMKNQNTYLHA